MLFEMGANLGLDIGKYFTDIANTLFGLIVG